MIYIMEKRMASENALNISVTSTVKVSLHHYKGIPIKIYHRQKIFSPQMTQLGGVYVKPNDATSVHSLYKYLCWDI